MDSFTAIDKCVDKERCRLSGDFDLLRHSPVFAGLNLDVVKLFAYLAKHISYKKGDYLIKQEEQARQAFILVKGSVEITVHHRNKEMLLQRLEQNTFFGELALLAQFRWFFNARAADELEVLVIERTAFQKVLEKFPEYKDRLIERMVQLRVDRLVAQTGEMLDQILLSSDKPITTAVI